MGSNPNINNINLFHIFYALFPDNSIPPKTTKNKHNKNNSNINAINNFINNNNNKGEGMESGSKSSWKSKEADEIFSPHQPFHIAFALALSVIPFLPASNLATWVGFVAAERVLYLPSMGAALLTAIGAQHLVIGIKGK